MKQAILGGSPHNESDKVTETQEQPLQHWLVFWQTFLPLVLYAPFSESYCRMRAGPTFLFLTNEGKAPWGARLPPVPHLWDFDPNDGFTWAVSSAPAQPTALGKEAQVCQGGVVRLITRQRPAGYAGVLRFMYRLYYIFRALTLRKALLKCFPLHLTFISKTIEVKGSISSGPDLKAHENCIHEVKKWLNN